MVEPEPSAPPAWHPDPYGGPDLRWWDGRRWTEHIASPAAPAPAPESWLQRVADVFDGSGELGLADLARQHASRLHPAGPPAPDGGVRLPPVLGVVPGAVAGAAAVSVWFADGEVRLLLAVAAAAVFLLVRGWRGLWNRWAILDTPTLDNAGARPGLCELIGRVEPVTGQPIGVAPFSGQSALAWRPSIDKWEKSGKNSKWVERWSDPNTVAIDAGFLVRSAGGAILVRLSDPARAFRDTAQDLVVRPDGIVGEKYRLREQGLAPGDPLFCLGHVAMAEDGTLVLEDPDVIVHGDERTALATESRWVFAGVAATTAVVASAAALVVGPSDAVLAGTAAVGACALVAGMGVVVRWWNRIIALVEQVRAAWAHLEVDLQRRHDTIGNLAVVVRAAAARENAVHTAAAEARAGLAGGLQRGVPDGDRVASVDAAVGAFAAVERQVFAVAEHYPSLRTSDNFHRVIDELRASENRIAAGRGFYNDAITLLDTRVDKLPGLLVRRWVLPTPRPALLTFAASDLGAATAREPG